MPRLRLGVALLLPSPVAEEVNGLRRAVGDRSLGRIPAHVTLAAPVNVSEANLARATALLRAAAAAAPSVMTLRLGAPTTFLPANPVLHLPVEGDLGGLHALRDRVLAPPLARPMAWPFVPHVTLADFTEADAGTERMAKAVEVLAGYRAVVRLERIHLLVETRSGVAAEVQGHQPVGRPGPRWQPLADVAFGPPAVVARGGPLAVELVRSAMVCPEAAELLAAEGVEGWGPYGCAAGPTLVVTARREQMVVGLAGAWMGPDGGRSAVIVAGAHRGQGIGRHLMAALTAAVVDAGWGCSDLRPVSPDDYTNRMAE